MSMLAAALSYAEHGVPIFPVWPVIRGACACRSRGCENPGKHPLASLAPHGLKDATIDPAVITSWWTRYPDANIATVTSWCVVLDVDTRKGGDETLAALEHDHGALPDAPEVLTGGGGRHLYFAPVPGVTNSAERIGAGLDIRASGGYVLLPPSTHISGRAYAEEVLHPLFETPLAAMPAWLVTLATAEPSATPEAGTNWASELAGAPAGRRHAVAVRIAGHLLGKRIAPAEVTTILLGFAERCVPPFDQADVRRIVADLAAKDATRARAAAGAVAPPSSDPVLIRLSDVQPEPVTWLWPQRLAIGKLALFIGEPGVGKTYVALDIAARVTQGGAWPDGALAPQGGVVILTAEDGLADTLRPRLDATGADVRRVVALRGVRVGVDTAPFTLERDLPALEAALVAERATLVIIDPLSAYLGSRDSYRDSEIRGILGPLAHLSEKYRVAILGLLHLTKAAQKRLLLRAQGSIAFVAQARTVLAIGEDPEQPARRLCAGIKNNLGPLPPTLAFRITASGLTWDAASVDGRAEELLAGDEVILRSEQRDRDAAKKFLRTALEQGAVSSKQLQADARDNGIAQRTLWRAKTDLGIETEQAVTASGKRAWYWALPPV